MVVSRSIAESDMANERMVLFNFKPLVYLLFP